MPNMETYDIVVFGGGKAGKTLAMDQAKSGKRVALVEIGMIGGACINVACIPTKTLVRGAEVADLIRRSLGFGMAVSGPTTNMARVAARTAEVVAGMVEFHVKAFQASGLDLILGRGRFVAPRVIAVDTATGLRHVTAPRIYVNLGTVADIPDLPGLRAAAPLTHVEALLLTELPSRLLILGGGYIGMEMAQAFHRLGSDVTIIDHGPRLAAREDADVSDAIQALFAADGIALALDARPVGVEGKSGEAVTVRLADGRSLSGTHLLVAAGRRPRTDDIGLDVAGIAVDSRGYITADEHLLTTAPDIWAMGEVAGSPMFTHISYDDYRIAKSGIEGGTRSTTGRMVPYCVFIDPEFARVGLSETAARQAGTPYRLAKIPMDLVPRARTMSETRGFMKALIGATDDRILGFAMFGTHAGEVMATVQVAMLGGLPYTALRDAVLAHPTLAEGLNVLFGGKIAKG